MKINWYIIGTIVLVVILIIYLLYTYRDSIFGTSKNPSRDGKEIEPGLSVFPLKNGVYNVPEVAKLQTYLNSKGGKGCDGLPLVIDSDFGINTECATKQILGVSEVTEEKYKSLGL